MTVQLTQTKYDAIAAARLLHDSPACSDNDMIPDNVIEFRQTEYCRGLRATQAEDGSNIAVVRATSDMKRMQAGDLWLPETLEAQHTKHRAERFWNHIDERVASLREAVVEFANKLLADPTYLLRNYDDAVRNAGRYEVWSRIASYRDNVVASQNEYAAPVAFYLEMKRIANDEVLRAASQFGQSTSPTSTAGDKARLEAWARVARDDLFF